MATAEAFDAVKPRKHRISGPNCDKNATGAGRIVRWRVHFLTLVWRECFISAAVLAGRVPPVGQAFWYVPVSDQ
jgi:hypothetical protein